MKFKVKIPVLQPASRDRQHSKRPESTKWVEIGRAWQDNPNEKITVVLDAIPFRSEYVYLYPEEEES